MNFWTYIGITPGEMEEYLDKRLVQRQHHPEFPLDIYTYGRKAVQEQVWDNVTLRCRGVVVHRETGEVIARPFEKFFNLGDSSAPYENDADSIRGMIQPVVWEKLDGFLCTLYRWEGKGYIASKGSFESPHAKWATKWYQEHVKDEVWPTGYTPVFEGITPHLRIVVDYKGEEGLFLLGVINNETGEEIGPLGLRMLSDKAGVGMPDQYAETWQEAQQNSYEKIQNKEGYVLTWYRDKQPPFRLKLKYIEYLRIHRMVTGMSPKRILEVLENGWTEEMNALLNESTPWFNKFVAKWKRAIETEFIRIAEESNRAFQSISRELQLKLARNEGWPTRKDWAIRVNLCPEEIRPVVYAIMDGKDIKPIIWKKVKNSPIMQGGKPMIDAHSI